MTTGKRDPCAEYGVVMSHEEQHSIWPAEKELPRETDIRPLSLRQKMADEGL